MTQESVSAAGSAHLRKAIGRPGYFALGFGVIVGSGWVVVLGDWLRIAGPGGAILGFAAGGVLIAFIAAVYAELSARMPEAGGEFIYAYKLYGPRTGFFVGWFVTLYLIAVTAFEAIVLPWMLETVFPELRGPVLYSVLGQEVTLGAVIIGLTGVVLITFLNARDVRLAVAFQTIVTYGFLIVAATVLVLGASFGEVANIRPLFATQTGHAWWVGSLWIFANCAFFLNGFQVIPQAIEERSEGVGARSIARIMIVSVAAAALFYCLAVLCSSLASPWRGLANSQLAAAVAVEKILPGGLLAKAVLLAAAASLLKTWNAVALMAARILLAQARVGLLPRRFGSIHPRYSTPHVAVLLVGACSCAGVFLGRGAVLPLLNMSSICLAATFIVCCLGVLRLRRGATQIAADYRAPGGTILIVVATLAAAAISLFALVEPLTRSADSAPLEWLLIASWAAVGAFFLFNRGRTPAPRLPINTT